MLVLLTGGARSGKSRFALELVDRHSAPVTFIATGEPGDDEMAHRIAQHRDERPADWDTIEEPLRIDAALRAAAADASIILDCLTLWTSNANEQLGSDETEALAIAAADVARLRDGLTVVVTNEVGLGLVPDNPLGREFRDLLGRVNAIWAAVADHVLLVVAGRAVALPRGEDAIEALR
jgi:adenosylcobinamide kinase/adenosylcobinamide-phosphate guanylyltransferase